MKTKLEEALEKGAVMVVEQKDYAVVEWPKKFNVVAFVLLLILGVIPAFFYLLYYAGKQPKKEYLRKGEY